MDSLRRVQAAMSKGQPKKIRIDVATRWGSLLLMLQDLHTLHAPIRAVLEPTETNCGVPPLSSPEVELVGAIIKILGTKSSPEKTPRE